jgi:hypothetical protein
MKLNKNEIKRCLFLSLLLGGFFYGWMFYDEGKEQRKDEEYKILCEENIANYDVLYTHVYNWNWENEFRAKLESLSYFLLLMFADKNEHEKFIPFFYFSMQDKHYVSDLETRRILNIQFNYAFNEAFSKVMSLEKSKKKIYKKENICYVYQKYIIDVATQNDMFTDEVEKYCDGLVEVKRFKENKG